MGNYDNYDFDGLNDYEVELAKGYIDMSELNLNMVKEDECASNDGIGIIW